MSFLRRMLGGGTPGPTAGTPAATGAAPEVDEAARDRELLREEAARLSDDLIARQIRYADRKWTPPTQGGERRADDAAAPEG
ncbi:MAG: hypothetical protein WCK58_11815 [Chloroflexota bacterium]